jgi:YVTN family beta-propeller protein
MNGYVSTFLRSIGLLLVTTAMCAAAQAGTRAYVTNRGLQNVSVVDLATNTVVANVPVETPGSIVVAPDGFHVYVASRELLDPNFNLRQQFVVSIDTATNSVVANIPLNGGPVPVGAMVSSPDSTKVYVLDGTPAGGAVDVIDTATNTIAAVIPVPTNNLRSLIISPDGNHLYIADGAIGDVYVADTAANAVVATIPEVPSDGYYLHMGTTAMAISPDGSRLYTSDGGLISGFMSIIDTASNTRLSTFSTLSGLFTMTMTPDGTRIYATGQPDSGPYFVIDLTTFTTAVVGDGFRAWWQAAITPDGASAYLTDELYDTLVQFDTATNTEVAAIQMPLHPIHTAGGTSAIAIGQIPDAIPFAAFNVARLQVNSQGFSESGSFRTGASGSAAAASPNLDPSTQRVTLTVGGYSLVIPQGSFRKDGPNLHWKFEGTVGDAKVNADIKQQGKSSNQFDYSVEVKGPNLTTQAHPLRAGLRIGLNVGTALVP